MLNNTRVFPSLAATLTGQSLVSQAGLNVLTYFLDATGFGALCEEQLADFVPETATHRPGRILGSLVVMLADGGEHVSDFDTLRDSAELFGPVASNATVSRFVALPSASPEAFTLGFATLTKALRTKIWEAAGPRNPATLATRLDPMIIDLDATLVNSHSEKEWAAGDYKGGFGHSPFVASCDYGKANGSGEVLSAVLRAGNKGTNSAVDRIWVLEKALEQLPDSMRDEHGALRTENILIRTDSAGASREFLNYLDKKGLQFSTSYTLPVPNERFVHWINDKDLWERVIEQDGYERHDAWVIKATKVIPLKDYPIGTRLYLRAEPPTSRGSSLHLRRRRAPVDRVLDQRPALQRRVPRREAPCQSTVREPHQDAQEQRHGQAALFGISSNQLWTDLAVLAMNLVAWMSLAVLFAGHEAGVWDLKRWRYRLFSIAEKITSSARKKRLLILDSAPEPPLLVTLLKGSARTAAQAAMNDAFDGHQRRGCPLDGTTREDRTRPAQSPG